jgi:hypothetical protein
MPLGRGAVVVLVMSVVAAPGWRGNKKAARRRRVKISLTCILAGESIFQDDFGPNIYRFATRRIL